MPYVKPKIAREKLGVSDGTLRSWAENNFIKCIKSNGGYRLYDIDSFIKPQEDSIPKNDSTKKIKYIYARVSSSKQKSDLQRQIDFLKEKHPEHTVVSETASGINFERKGLNKIMDEAIKGNVSEVVVAHRDRLCRIAWKHFSWLFNRLGVDLIVQDEQTYSPESELQEDLFTIIHVFSCRHYGSRRKYTKTTNKDKIPEKQTEDRKHDVCEECKEGEK